ncbi:dTDP-4-dehydrorhamnose reductase [Pseudoalteromonas sp. S4389]|uniref:sugar nucleotide-binding protein n=1 Tax=Pseudoalteromonas sp. S4389 TaxID=579556 RepID=UPI0011092A4D|nr:sugar nucleotide-binding protein [Pseudoalteromonas sp. S4389]TMO44825.1 dTDP-4-dehydrorhamnose reductase [Pseudoalteromonas sp. S4389]
MEKTQRLTPIIFGASGLLGRHLFNYFSTQDPDTIGTYNNSPSADLQHFNLIESPFEQLQLNSGNNYIAIICASLTNISYINANPELAAITNITGTTKLIHELNQRNIPIIFISSDNVFSGEYGNYFDYSPMEPVSEYGKQKKTIELELQKATSGTSCILRLAKIIGNNHNDGTILNDIVSQLQSNQSVKAAKDLIFNPTAIDDIVIAIEMLITTKAQGIFNFCNPERFNRFELACLLAKKLNINPKIIQPILFSDIDKSGKRPLNTSMNNSTIFDGFAFQSVESCINLQRASWTK